MSSGAADIRLLAFSSFPTSGRFLRGLEDEIRVSRWGRSQPTVCRPDRLATPDAMRSEIQGPSRITVVSAHADTNDDDALCLRGARQPRSRFLAVESIGDLGATSAVLVDACWFESLAAVLQPKAKPGSLLIGLKDPGGQGTRGQDSVSILAAVIRELCFPRNADLSPAAVRQAVGDVNYWIRARNRAERHRTRHSAGRRGLPAIRPLIDCRQC